MKKRYLDVSLSVILGGVVVQAFAAPEPFKPVAPFNPVAPYDQDGLSQISRFAADLTKQMTPNNRAAKDAVQSAASNHRAPSDRPSVHGYRLGLQQPRPNYDRFLYAVSYNAQKIMMERLGLTRFSRISMELSGSYSLFATTETLKPVAYLGLGVSYRIEGLDPTSQKTLRKKYKRAFFDEYDPYSDCLYGQARIVAQIEAIDQPKTKRREVFSERSNQKDNLTQATSQKDKRFDPSFKIRVRIVEKNMESPWVKEAPIVTGESLIKYRGLAPEVVVSDDSGFFNAVARSTASGQQKTWTKISSPKVRLSRGSARTYVQYDGFLKTAHARGLLFQYGPVQGQLSHALSTHTLQGSLGLPQKNRVYRLGFEVPAQNTKGAALPELRQRKSGRIVLSVDGQI
jgi:hypothetical protein